MVCLAVHASADAQNHPNVILILGDDIGYESLSINGGKSYNTPNLNTMAAEGMNFTQCHALPLCAPSRTLLLTGKYNFRNYTVWGTLNTDQKTLGNMFQDAGYKTACFGKWQLNGGDASIHTFGFDSYCVLNPLGSNEDLERYKNPSIYVNGEFVPDNLVQGKYSDDIFTDSVLNFIGNNKNNPFFIYYPMALCHPPFQPTPDDPEFVNWIKGNDTAFFPSMMQYMDKKIGQIISKVKEAGIEDNTVIIFTGDNGTPENIYEYTGNDSIVVGGKGKTVEAGIRVPMIVYWHGTIRAGTINNDLVDFVDFMPSLADIANIPPLNYTPLDGVSFAPQLKGDAGTARNWLFSYYQPGGRATIATRWAQTIQYKLYDTSDNERRYFYDIIKDPAETNPISNDLLTPEQQQIKQTLLDVINGYTAQGFALLAAPKILSVTDSSALIRDSVEINGGSTITSSGIVWGTAHDPVLTGSNHTSENAWKGGFNSLINGLKSNTTYYARSYATNLAGTAYSNEVAFTTPSVAPVCNDAIEIRNISFLANWKLLDKINNYRIDVSASPDFAKLINGVTSNGFDSGTISNDGWIFSKGIDLNTDKFGVASPSIEFKYSNKSVTTATLSGYCTKLSFWISSVSNGNPGSLLIEGFDGSLWRSIDNITDVSKTPAVKTYDSVTSNAFKKDLIAFRFTYTKTNGDILLDDINMNYTETKPSFLPNYENVPVSSDSIKITGLNKNSNYYYRIRAENTNGTSGNSNTIAVTTTDSTLDTPMCTPATSIDTTSFVANWKKLTNADKYKIDVSTSPDFSVFVKGYENLDVTTDSVKITGLESETKYYYRIRAISSALDDTSDNSNIIDAVTLKNSLESGDIDLKIFPNPTTNEFNAVLKTQLNKPVQFIVIDTHGSIVYRSKLNSNGSFVFGKNFSAGTYFLRAMQDNTTKTFKIIKLNK